MCSHWFSKTISHWKYLLILMLWFYPYTAVFEEFFVSILLLQYRSCFLALLAIAMYLEFVVVIYFQEKIEITREWLTLTSWLYLTFVELAKTLFGNLYKFSNSVQRVCCACTLRVPVRYNEVSRKVGSTCQK